MEKALALTEEVLDYGLDRQQPDTLNIYNTLLELGALYQALGRLGEAEATFEEAFAGLMDEYGETHPSTLVATNNLGQLYEAIGLYDEAEPILEEALANFEKALGEAHPDALRARNNLALLYESQGNFREAEPLYQESLDLMLEARGENYTDTVAVRNNLASLYMLMEEYEKSAPMFEQVVTRWEQLLGPEHQNTMKAVNNLGRVYLKMGRPDEAAPLFERAIATRTRVLGENHVDTIRSMIDLAGLKLEQDRLPEAEELVTDALDRAETVLSEQHPYTFDALNMLIRIKRAQGELQAAADFARTGLVRRSEFFDRMLWSTGQNAREGFIRLHRPELFEYLSLLTELNAEEAGRRMLEASLQRKGLLLKITSEIQQIATMSDDPALTPIVEELKATRRELAALTLSGPTPETRGRHAEALYELEQEVNDLQAQLGRASTRYRSSISNVSIDSLIEEIPDGSALVDFLAYEEDGTEKIMAGVMVKEEGEVRFDLVNYDDRNAVQEATLEYRSWIQDDLADEIDVRYAGQDAYDAVWAPLEGSLNDADYVYVVPDGVLNILPFSALMSPDEEYLIENVDLHLLTSSRDLLPSRFQLVKGDYIIVAGPDYDSEDIIPQEEIKRAQSRRSTAEQLDLRAAGTGLRGLSFAPLPGATEEGRKINQQVEQNDEPNIVYFGEEAEEMVLNTLRSPPEILHMATHGFFLEADDSLRKRLLKQQRSAELHVPPPGDNPLLRAGLAFAGINNNAPFLGDIDTNNDGVLTALEVLDLDLSGTQLVVLSACETGVGEIHDGEGVYGLRRSFQEAGVAEVISSLWEVSDAGTQALMTAFYERLLDGTPARVALREAQLELIESPRWGYPFVWSAFMIVGSYESAGLSVN
ncbi:MAG: CHAT domain-containing tetratricopeptide repeat protein [Gammaproteobacteria bacterium]|nr:CHAT domain-containing tetratricopeptide repeat protein [Gammaproteobacteria bacterium]